MIGNNLIVPTKKTHSGLIQSSLIGAMGQIESDSEWQKSGNHKPFMMDTLRAEKKPMSLTDTGSNRQWAELDSNQRKLTLTGLQPVPFSHSGTDPNEKSDSTDPKP